MRPVRTRTWTVPTTLWLGEDGTTGITLSLPDGGLYAGDVVTVSITDPGDARVTRIGLIAWGWRRLRRRRRRRVPLLAAVDPGTVTVDDWAAER